MSSGGSAPPAPDYTGAAEATAAGNQANLNQQTIDNRPNQTTPWGSSTWTQGPSTTDAQGNTVQGQWSQSITLSPAEQQALNSQQAIQQNQSSLAQGLQGQVASTMAGGFNAPSLSSYMQGVGSTNQNFAGFNPTGTGNVNQQSYNPNAYTRGNEGVNQNLWTGANNLNQNLQTSANPVNQNFSSGAQNLNTNFSGNGSNVNQTLGANPNNVNTNFSGNGSGVDTSLQSSGQNVNTNAQAAVAPAGSVNQNTPTFSTADAQAGAQSAYQAQVGLLQPQMQQDTTNLDSQLRLQGLTPGSEAYNNAMQNLQRTQAQTLTQASNQAVQTGNNEANQNYASALAGYQANLGAQGQAYNQNANTFTLGNAAQGQQYSQDANTFNANNTAVGQQYNQNLGAFNADNSAAGQQFSQGNTAFNSQNAAAGQAYNQNLGAFNANNSALQAQYGQDANTFSLGNTAQNQAYTQGANTFQLNNAASTQQAANATNTFNAQNAARTQANTNSLANYQAALQGQSAYNTAQQQSYNQALAGYGANQSAQAQSNAAQQQAFSQGLQGYGTAYSSALNNYLQPLNSMNAVLNGNQVQSPSMPSFATAGYTPGADMTGAATATGNYNQSVYNANQASAASTNSALTGLAGSGLMAAATLF